MIHISSLDFIMLSVTVRTHCQMTVARKAYITRNLKYRQHSAHYRSSTRALHRMSIQ
jgi:hypothetical protein